MISGGGSLLRQSISPWLFVIGRLRRQALIVGMAPRLTETLRQWISFSAGACLSLYIPVHHYSVPLTDAWCLTVGVCLGILTPC